MDALRRAEAEKKQQEARAARATPEPPPVDSEAVTRISPFAGSEDVTLQIERNIFDPPPSPSPPPAPTIAQDGDASLSLSRPLALEPLDPGQTFIDTTLIGEDDDPTSGGTTLAARSPRTEQTSTAPSSRGMRDDLNAYFEPSRSMEIPRNGGRRTETLEDIASHTVVGAQTVFTASARPRAGRILMLGTSFAVIAVLAIGALGLFYAWQSRTPYVVPSPSVATGVEKPLVRELPVVALETKGAATPPPLMRIDTEIPGTQAAAGEPATAAPAPLATAPAATLPQVAPAVSAVPPATVVPAPITPPAVAAAPPAAAVASAPVPQAVPQPTVDVSAGEVRIARSAAPAAVDASLQRAYMAFGNGDLDQAEALYRVALTEHPDRRDALLGLGAVALKRGDLARAYQNYAAVLKLQPDDAVASAALFSLTGGDGEGTAARLRMLLDSHGDAAFIHFALGNWYARKQRWGDAQAAYFDAVRLDAGNPDYNYNLAISLDRMGHTQAALEYYQKSLTLADTSGGAFNPANVLDRIKSLSAAP